MASDSRPLAAFSNHHLSTSNQPQCRTEQTLHNARFSILLTVRTSGPLSCLFCEALAHDIKYSCWAGLTPPQPLPSNTMLLEDATAMRLTATVLSIITAIMFFFAHREYRHLAALAIPVA